ASTCPASRSRSGGRCSCCSSIACSWARPPGELPEAVTTRRDESLHGCVRPSYCFPTDLRKRIEPHLEELNAHPKAVGLFDNTKLEDWTQQFLLALERTPEIREWIEGQLAAATAGGWTAFECLATDLWVAALNSSPMPFAQDAANHKAAGGGADGSSGKQIPI